MDSNSPNQSKHLTLSDEFVSMVRDCLDHIYDLPHLNSKPLSIPSSDIQLIGKSIRIELMRMIENLNPGLSFSLSSREARFYNLLRLRYLQKMGVEEIANMLSLSIRQTYRDLRISEEKLAGLVWEYLTHKAKSTDTQSTNSSTEGEISLLAANFQRVDLIPILNKAIQVTSELAIHRKTRISLSSFPETLMIMADPTIAQQLMVSLMSYSIRQVYSGTLIEIFFKPNPLSLEFRYAFDTQLTIREPISIPIAQLAERLNWSFIQAEPSTWQSFVIELNQKQKAVMIIEDNEGVVELFRRFLTDQPVSVISPVSSMEGLRLVVELLPDIVILDVMMKGIDGWDCLRRIKSDPRTAHIPVVICSVFFEPDLASSLGASAFLSKPINQTSLINLLREHSIL